MMKTPLSTLEELSALAGELDTALSAVLDHSGINHRPAFSPNSPAIWVGNPFTWSGLSSDHQRLSKRARELLDVWEALAEAAVRAAAPARLESFREFGELMRAIVDQSAGDGAPAGDIVGIRNQLVKVRQHQLNLLTALPSAHGAPELLVVPDSNALVYQPAVEDWNPTDGDWTLVVVPQVIRELDELKLRPGDLGEAAGSFIRRLDGYGERGDTFTGVPLRPRARVRELPIEADMARAPSWLQAGHADDQLLASTLELRWQELNARVVLVTRDRNLRNKARLARVSCVRVEDIAEPRPQPKPKGHPREAEAEGQARARLDGDLPFARSELEVPPATTGTNPNQQSWTVQASPLFIPAEFKRRVLGDEAPAWFKTRAAGLFREPNPLPSSEPHEATRQHGFAVKRDFLLPVKGSVKLVADAGGIVGVRYYTEPPPGGRRLFALAQVEGEVLQSLIGTCAEALDLLGVTGPVLLDAWASGVSDSELLTAGHPTLAKERDGWLQQGLVRMTGELTLPADEDAIATVAASCAREFARAAGIPARE
jgi:hypothetical protein